MSLYNAKSLKEVLLDLTNHYRFKEGISQVRVKSAWHDCLGPLVGRHTLQLRLIRRNLFVVVDSAPLKQELHYQRETIVAKLNEKLGDDYLDEIVVR